MFQTEQLSGDLNDLHGELSKLIRDTFRNAQRLNDIGIPTLVEYKNPQPDLPFPYSIESIAEEWGEDTRVHLYRHQVVTDLPVIGSRTIPTLIQVDINDTSDMGLPHPAATGYSEITDFKNALFTHRESGGRLLPILGMLAISPLDRSKHNASIIEMPVGTAICAWLIAAIREGKLIAAEQVQRPVAGIPVSYS